MVASQEAPAEYLPNVIGEKLSSVTFVLNYVQVDFDGKQFTAYSWPTVGEKDRRTNFEDHGYRDALCSLIARVVVNVEHLVAVLRIRFSDGSALDFDILEEEDGREKLMFHDTTSNIWSFW